MYCIAYSWAILMPRPLLLVVSSLFHIYKIVATHLCLYYNRITNHLYPVLLKLYVPCGKLVLGDCSECGVF